MRPPPPDAVPTLTDVVGFGDAPASVPSPSSALPASLPGQEAGTVLADPVRGGSPDGALPTAHAVPDGACSSDAAPSVPAVRAPIDEEDLTQRVLLDVQRQVDRMFDFRVRESVGPAFGHLLETFLRETREELNQTLRDVVRRAVAQELARHRSR